MTWCLSGSSIQCYTAVSGFKFSLCLLWMVYYSSPDCEQVMDPCDWGIWGSQTYCWQQCSLIYVRLSTECFQPNQLIGWLFFWEREEELGLNNYRSSSYKLSLKRVSHSRILHPFYYHQDLYCGTVLWFLFSVCLKLIFDHTFITAVIIKSDSWCYNILP